MHKQALNVTLTVEANGIEAVINQLARMKALLAECQQLAREIGRTEITIGIEQSERA